MATPLEPITVSAGQNVPVNLSQYTGGRILLGAKITNESNLAVKVGGIIAGGGEWLPAFVENMWYGTQNAPLGRTLQLTAEAVSSATNPPSAVLLVTLYFYGDNDLPTNGSWPIALMRMANVGNPITVSSAQDLDQYILSAGVLSGLSASKDVSIANQLDVTSGVAFLKQATSNVEPVSFPAANYTTSTHTATYFLDLNPDGTTSFGTAHSVIPNSLPVWIVTTDGSGNILTVSQQGSFGVLDLLPSYGYGPLQLGVLATNPGTAINNGLEIITGGLTFASGGGAPSGPPVPFNVIAYGADPTGVSDSTSAITQALSAANSAGGGMVYFPRGTYISGAQTLYSNVYLCGDGTGATILKLKNASNADLLSSNVANININNQTSNNGSTTGISNFGILNMTLDGNYTNQSSGPCYPLRFYGYGYLLQNLDVRNGYSGGIQADWNGGLLADNHIEATWDNVRVYQSLGTSTSIGIEFGGPHDTRWSNILCYISNSHDVHQGPHSGTLQMQNCHFWNSDQNNGDANSVTFLCEGAMYCSNCEFEGSVHAQLVLLANSVQIVGGAIFGSDAIHNGDGVRIGQQAGLTPYTNSAFQSAGLTTAVPISGYRLQTTFIKCYGSGGAIVFNNDGGQSVIDAAVIAKNATDAIFTGTPGSGTWLRLNNSGFNDVRKVIDEVIGTPGSVFARGMSSTAPDPGNGGTINTAGLFVSRVLPAAAETGLILQAGTQHGQVVIVENLSANTLTFAAKATSNVWDGVSDIIPANAARMFTWDGANTAWFRMA